MNLPDGSGGTVQQHPVPWERCYPGRIDFEINEFRGRDIPCVVDNDALASGRLEISIDWTMENGRVLTLLAIYPDTYPRHRPQVLLKGGIDPLPEKHCSPIDGNLCLLGRDSAQWTPSLTLFKLLEEKLEDCINGTGDEDPQGEPAEFWWNGGNPTPSFCLIDSSWTFDDDTQGTLTLAIRYERPINVHDENLPPVMRAYVKEVFDRNGKPLHKWTGPLPLDLKSETVDIEVPWLRRNQTLQPSPGWEQAIKEIHHGHDPFMKAKLHKHAKDHRYFRIIAIIHPMETGFQQQGVGIIPFLIFGKKKAFTGGGKPGQYTQKITTLPVLRAGVTDVASRAPQTLCLQGSTVFLAGSGALGGFLAIELARNGCGSLHILDHDVVEPGNTIRWPLGAEAWGVPKVDALAGFIERNYPSTQVSVHRIYVGGTGGAQALALEELIAGSDIIIDASAANGVTYILDDLRRNAGKPMMTLHATPNMTGGIVALLMGHACYNCLARSWADGRITRPPGQLDNDGLVQPPGCSERTFTGAGYDLQEISLQAMRLIVRTLADPGRSSAVVQTLSFVDDAGNQVPPSWREDPLLVHPECGHEDGADE